MGLKACHLDGRSEGRIVTVVIAGEYWGLWSQVGRYPGKMTAMNFDSDPSSQPATWAWTVTDTEIRVAKRDWLRARDNDAPADEVALAFEYFRMLIAAQAQQIAEEFRAQHSA